MSEHETWDDGDTSKQSEQQSTLTAGKKTLGVGRGKARPEANNEEPASPAVSKWNGGQTGTSQGFGSFRNNNNDENSNPNSGGGFGSRNNTGGSSFGARNGRGGFGGGSNSFSSNNDSNSRACYNCNQTGHMSRDCPDPRKDDRGGRSGGGGFNSGSGGGGFSSRGGGRGGFNSGDNSRGGFNSGNNNRGGFNSGENNRGGFNSGSGGRGGFGSGSGDRGNFSSGGGDRDVNFGSTKIDGSSMSVTFQNNRNHNDNDRDNNRSNENNFEEFNRRSTFHNSGTRGGFNNGGGYRGGRGGGEEGGFRSGDRGGGGSGNCYNCQKPGHQSRDCPEEKKPRDGGSNSFFSGGGGRRNDRVSDDIFDQPEGRADSQPIERYIPPPAPTTEEDIFGEAATRGENFGKYHRTQVRCTPEGKLKPIDLYEESNMATQILSNIRRAHFEEPTPISTLHNTCIRQQDDIMACAQTGSGKTAAFLLPIISNLLEYHADELAEKHHPPAPFV